jgi:hypothetical protein
MNIINKIDNIIMEEYDVPMIKREKNKKLNPKTNRVKTFRKMMHHTTDVPPENRTFKNLPRYADGKSKVRFQDWLLIKPEKAKPSNNVPSIGKSAADGKWYGWSHRAVYGFGVGDKVTGDSGAKKVEYPKLPDGGPDWDNGKYEPDFTIKNDTHAKQVAITFADSVS